MYNLIFILLCVYTYHYISKKSDNYNNDNLN